MLLASTVVAGALLVGAAEAQQGKSKGEEKKSQGVEEKLREAAKKVDELLGKKNQDKKGDQVKKPPLLIATRDERATMEKEGVPKEDQYGYLEWMRAGRPSFEIDEARYAKLIPAPSIPKNAALGCQPNGDLEGNGFHNWQLYTLASIPPGSSFNWFTLSNQQNSYVDGGNWQFTNIGTPAVNSWSPGSQHAILPGSNSNWTNDSYYRTNVNPPLLLNGLNWNSGHDPLIATVPGQNLPIPFPNGGQRVMRLGNPTGTGEGGGAVWHFQVTPQTQDFGFRYAVNLEYAPWGGVRDHQTYEQPRFSFALVYPQGRVGGLFGNIGQPPMFINGFQEVAGSSGYNSGPLTWSYTGPKCYRFHIPDAYLGKWIYARFEARDCPFGRPGPPGTGIAGHGGYAFIDSVCDDTLGRTVLEMEKTTYCDSDRIMVDGHETDSSTQHVWTLQQTDQAGNPTDPATFATETVASTTIEPMDLAAWYRARGKRLKCGHYYTVSLTADVACGDGQPTKKTFYVECCGGDPSDCCDGKISVEPADLTPTMQTGTYRFSPVISYQPASTHVTKVEMELVQTEVKTSPSNGGYNGPVFSYFKNGTAPSGFQGPIIPYTPYGRTVFFKCPSQLLSGVQFPTLITLPASQSTSTLTELLHFIVRYRVTDTHCQTCEFTKHYYFRRKPKRPGDVLEPVPTPINPSNWPSSSSSGGQG